MRQPPARSLDVPPTGLVCDDAHVPRKRPPTDAADRTPASEAAVREAALTVFARLGYHGTALRNIADELRIRTPSLYNHMDSKQELLRAIVHETTELVWSEFESAVAGVADPAE